MNENFGTPQSIIHAVNRQFSYTSFFWLLFHYLHSFLILQSCFWWIFAWYMYLVPWWHSFLPLSLLFKDWGEWHCLLYFTYWVLTCSSTLFRSIGIDYSNIVCYSKTEYLISFYKVWCNIYELDSIGSKQFGQKCFPSPDWEAVYARKGTEMNYEGGRDNCKLTMSDCFGFLSNIFPSRSDLIWCCKNAFSHHSVLKVFALFFWSGRKVMHILCHCRCLLLSREFIWYYTIDWSDWAGFVLPFKWQFVASLWVHGSGHVCDLHIKYVGCADMEGQW